MQPGDDRQRVSGDGGGQEKDAALPDPAVGQLATEDGRLQLLLSGRVCPQRERQGNVRTVKAAATSALVMLE